MNTNSKGQLAVLKIQERAMEKDIVTSIPTTAVSYDMILDDHGKLHRVQCKYADGSSSNSDGAVVAHIGKRTGNSKYRNGTYTKEHADAILIYVPKVDKVLWIPPQVFMGKVSLMFRIAPTQNGQNKGINFVESFVW